MSFNKYVSWYAYCTNQHWIMFESSQNTCILIKSLPHTKFNRNAKCFYGLNIGVFLWWGFIDKDYNLKGHFILKVILHIYKRILTFLTFSMSPHLTGLFIFPTRNTNSSKVISWIWTNTLFSSKVDLTIKKRNKQTRSLEPLKVFFKLCFIPISVTDPWVIWL